MANARDAKKLKRLVLAQTMAESMAKSQVGSLSAELAGLEEKLNQARDAFTNSQTSNLFSDMHLKHINSLTTACEQVRQKLENARQELHSETARNKKLRGRLKDKLMHLEREEEQRLLLERLDRSAVSR